jgi:hypothetical protein
MTIYISTKCDTESQFIVDANDETEAITMFNILWGKGVTYRLEKGFRLFDGIREDEIIRINRKTGCLIIPSAYGPAEEGWVGKLSEW